MRSRLTASLRLTALVTASTFATLGCDGKRSRPKPVTSKQIGTTTQPAAEISIVVMGDSLTEGYGLEPEQAYPAQLEQQLHAAKRDVSVVNAGISGETSRGARSRVDWVLSLKPDIVVLETGANDGLRGINPQETAKNLDFIVEQFQEQGIVVVVAGMRMVQNMGAEYVEAFRSVFPRIAKARNVTLIPFFLEGVAGDGARPPPDPGLALALPLPSRRRAWTGGTGPYM